MIRNAEDKVQALYPLMSNRNRAGRAESGAIYFDYQTLGIDPSIQSGVVALGADDILHILGLGFDEPVS